MKTKLFITLIACVVVGIVFPAFAVTPDKEKEAKTKVEVVANNEECPLPPTLVTIPIILDVSSGCSAIYCTNLWIIVRPATSSCEAIGSTILKDQQYVQGNNSFNLIFDPLTYSYVIITLYSPGHNPCPGYNETTSCCEDLSDIKTCTLQICP